MNRQAGVGLVEVLLALSLGLVLLLGASRLFLAATQSWQAQGIAAQLQEDARLALQRMAQDIRMSGMFGCLRADAISHVNPSSAQAFAQPLEVIRAADGQLQQLSLISAEVAGAGGRPNWTLVTDCISQARVYLDVQAAPAGHFAIPIRRQTYRVDGTSLMLGSGASYAPLIDNLGELRVDIISRSATRIAGLRLSLTLLDPLARVRPQQYQLTVALRNG
ncbi:prepilin-type N-terminal cleavage/methylation domain-containing protein [Pseudomonas sp. B21-012]|uniref:PilW family protein n=1 Tax=Pseudomonas sp. B21-012 TaxID=2895472 RepID=UPI00215E44AC|nr:prepilin-type N-terminal cleavage/methylation domain-containing protein [Pseudomonas sp. B21-012]UVM55197.1 prepilin-type N-terminal cleavage/methylation domain-containing protein [Pseudomonas sp. B21-012]